MFVCGLKIMRYNKKREGKKTDVAYCAGFVGDWSGEHRQQLSFSPLITTV